MYKLTLEVFYQNPGAAYYVEKRALEQAGIPTKKDLTYNMISLEWTYRMGEEAGIRCNRLRNLFGEKFVRLTSEKESSL